MQGGVERPVRVVAVDVRPQCVGDAIDAGVAPTHRNGHFQHFQRAALAAARQQIAAAVTGDLEATQRVHAETPRPRVDLQRRFGRHQAAFPDQAADIVDLDAFIQRIGAKFGHLFRLPPECVCETLFAPEAECVAQRVAARTRPARRQRDLRNGQETHVFEQPVLNALADVANFRQRAPRLGHVAARDHHMAQGQAAQQLEERQADFPGDAQAGAHRLVGAQRIFFQHGLPARRSSGRCTSRNCCGPGLC